MLSSHFYPKIDGTVRAIDLIIRTLVKRGHHITLITRKLPGTSEFEIYERAEIYRLGPSGRSMFARMLFGINQARLAIWLLRNRRVDILQAHGFSSMIACFILEMVFGIPIVLFFHGFPRIWSVQFRWRKRYEQFLSFPIERYLVRRASRIVVRSDLFGRILIGTYGRGFEDRIKTLPHCVDTEIFCFHKIGLGGPAILFVGSLARVYGVDLLLRAAPSVIDNIPEAEFIIVGDGPLELQLKRMACELGIEESVRFVGRIDDPIALAQYYHLSSVVVIPLYYQGYILSLVAVEALACGRPVITTMLLEPGLENIGVFSVKTHDPEDLAKSILHVLRDIDLGSTVLAARKYVEENHSQNMYGPKLENIYFELVRGRR